MSDNPLVMKLSGFIDLASAERAEIESWCVSPKRFAAREMWISEGDRPEATCIMLSGWAYRYKDTVGGKRQVVGFMLPGDMCDLHGFILRSADHNIAMLSDAVVAVASSDKLRDSLAREPRLLLALWWSMLVDQGIAREWLVNVGQRDAATRVASLVCELWLRASQVGLVREGAFSVPLRQAELGETLGLTSVHINRTLKALRERELLVFKGGQVTIGNVDKLMKFADFNPTYLQLKRRG